ncbi:MAG TPA: hypothetical protein VG347_05010 [Verrucomicrobiae bacterium]|nr:hypothetical protein [Verrucomicrobiae bacterium]
MMLAEDIAKDINWTLITAIVMTLATVAMWWDARKSRTTNTVITNQPLTVEIVKALHEQFANKEEFDKHVGHNTDRHAQIFKTIERVERTANAALEKQVETVRKDLVVVGNHVAGLQTETKLQNQQLARMDAKLDRLAERKS